MSFLSNTIQSNQHERRVEARHKTYLSAIILHENQTLFTTVVNLSKSGLGILSGRHFETDEIFEISLTKKRKYPVRVKLNVQACREMNGEYLVGTKIIEASIQHAQFYEEIVHSHRQLPKVTR